MGSFAQQAEMLRNRIQQKLVKKAELGRQITRDEELLWAYRTVLGAQHEG